jgi:Predicted membrane protein (DUF2232)
MLRKLSAIEIAEGALLADIAIIFHLIATYLPVGSGIFELLIPTVFTVLVLRRGFYTSMMAVVVAMFVVCILTGLGAAIFMVLECGAGVFLGVTMKYRMPHFPLILLGVTSASFLVYGGTWLLALLIGTSVQHFVLQFHQVYNSIIHLINFAAPQLGLNGVWRHNLYPFIDHLVGIGFTYWWAFLFVLYWIALWPVVILVYYITNVLVRLLGYKVRPFPGGKLERFLHWLARRVVKATGRRDTGKRVRTQTVIPESRQDSIKERSKVEV